MKILENGRIQGFFLIRAHYKATYSRSPIKGAYIYIYLIVVSLIKPLQLFKFND